MKSNHISQSIQSLSKQLSKLVVLGEIVGEFDGREVGILKGRVVGSDVGVWDGFDEGIWVGETVGEDDGQEP